MPPLVEWALWRQLKGAFKVHRMFFTPIVPEFVGGHYPIRQFATMQEALQEAEGRRVFLEPTGTNALSKMPEGQIVLITGNSAIGNMHHAKSEEAYAIKTPQQTHLFPTEAAAIALAIRYGQ